MSLESAAQTRGKHCKKLRLALQMHMHRVFNEIIDYWLPITNYHNAYKYSFPIANLILNFSSKYTFGEGSRRQTIDDACRISISH